jgi:hypothetical protein
MRIQKVYAWGLGNALESGLQAVIIEGSGFSQPNQQFDVGKY